MLWARPKAGEESRTREKSSASALKRGGEGVAGGWAGPTLASLGAEDE